MSGWLILLLALVALPPFLAGAVALWTRLRHPCPRGPFPPGHALPPATTGPIAAFQARLASAAPDTPELVRLLEEPSAALAARLELIAAAQASVDLQYYIWQDDTAGARMLAALRAAAGRGVRIRLLLDDNGTQGMDERLADLNSLPGAELRLFNPFPLRRARLLSYLTDFRRLNRRMHNKAMVVDGGMAILGGRNIGDDYFNTLAPGGLYMDLDVAVAGPVVAEVQAQFDAYWNAPPSVPAAQILPAPTSARSAELRAQEAARLARPAARPDTEALAEARRACPLLAPDSPFLPARTRLVADPPEKIGGRVPARQLLWTRMRRALGHPRQELILMSPYLVPMRPGLRLFTRYLREGVQLRLLTNSFAATDVPLVHSGYAHRRRALLRRGAELYEYAPPGHSPRPARDFLENPPQGVAPFSRNKLHAKVFVVDQERLFIGSFNFDPRSLRLNTELGLVIDCPEAAQAVAANFERIATAHAWRLQLGPSPARRLLWTRPGAEPLRHEPGATLGSRLVLGIAQRLPIEWML
jgi:putative cardiolipin synthase